MANLLGDTDKLQWDSIVDLREIAALTDTDIVYRHNDPLYDNDQSIKFVKNGKEVTIIAHGRHEDGVFSFRTPARHVTPWIAKLVCDDPGGSVEGVPISIANKTPLTFFKRVVRAYFKKYGVQIREYLTEEEYKEVRSHHVFHRFFGSIYVDGSPPFCITGCPRCGTYLLPFSLGRQWMRCDCGSLVRPQNVFSQRRQKPSYDQRNKLATLRTQARKKDIPDDERLLRSARASTFYAKYFRRPGWIPASRKWLRETLGETLLEEYYRQRNELCCRTKKKLRELVLTRWGTTTAATRSRSTSPASAAERKERERVANNASHRRRYWNNPEKERERNRRKGRNRKRSSRDIAQRRRYYMANRAEIQRKHREWYFAHKAQVTERTRKWHQQNRKEIMQRRAAHAATNQFFHNLALTSKGGTLCRSH